MNAEAETRHSSAFHRPKWGENMQNLKSLLFGSFIAVFAGSLPAWSQVTTADVLGSVTDPSGAALVGAIVSVSNLATAASRSTMTDDNGDFLISGLPIGHYRLKTESKGFKIYDIPDLALAEGDRRRVDIRLVVGEVTESVQVSAQATALQSDSSSLGTLINERAVQDLPLNGRNFIRLAQLSMGANEDGDNALQSGNRPDDRRSSTAVAVNGQHGYNNNFMIDGLDDNERYIGSIVVKPAMDALAEFKLITNGYAAELGRTAGGVINLITKSGSSQFHGSLFEFFRNEKMDAKNFFAGPGATPAFKQNQFGGSLGGPIKKRNTFFFGDYEGLRLRQGITFTSSVPTLAMRAGDFSGLSTIYDPGTRTPYPGNQIPLSAMDPVSQKLVNLWPTPQKAGLVNNFTMSPNKQDREDKFDGRVDHQFNTSNSLFGRFSFNDGNIVTPGALPAVGNIQPVGINGGFPGPALIRAMNAGATYVHTFSPSFLMEQRIGYSRFANHVLPFNYGNNVMNQLGVPGINVDADSSGMSLFNVSGFQALGDSGSIPIIDYNNIYQYALTMTKAHGSHTFKWGTNLIDRRMMQFQSGSPKGSFSFDSNPTSNGAGSGGNSVASLLAGYPSSTSRSKTLYWPDFHGAEFGFYFQDDWRVSQRLTLNLGLRYDIITPLIEAHGQGCNLALGATSADVACANGVNANLTSKSGGVPIDYNDFSPRVGFAATLTSKTVLRGGFGISFFPPVNGNSQGMRNGNYVSTLSFSTTPATVNNRLSDGLPAPDSGQSAQPGGRRHAERVLDAEPCSLRRAVQPDIGAGDYLRPRLERQLRRRALPQDRHGRRNRPGAARTGHCSAAPRVLSSPSRRCLDPGNVYRRHCGLPLAPDVGRTPFRQGLESHHELYLRPPDRRSPVPRRLQDGVRSRPVPRHVHQSPPGSRELRHRSAPSLGPDGQLCAAVRRRSARRRRRARPRLAAQRHRGDAERRNVHRRELLGPGQYRQRRPSEPGRRPLCRLAEPDPVVQSSGIRGATPLYPRDRRP